MNRHLAIACWLHILAGLFVFGCVATIWVAAAALAPTFAGTFIPGLVSLFGKPIATILLTVATVQSACAVALLLGRSWPRVALGAISAALLFVFPIGTMLGIYTFFALSQPAVAAGGFMVDAASTGYRG